MTRTHILKQLKDQIGTKLYARFACAEDLDYFEQNSDLDLTNMDELWLSGGDPGDIMLELTVTAIKQVAKPSKPVMVDI